MSTVRAVSRFGLTLLLVAALSAFGCSGADVGATGSDATGGDGLTLPDVELPGPGEATVDTLVVPETVAVGEAVAVSCPVTPDKFNAVPTEVTLADGAEDDTYIDDHAVTFGAPGEYTLACRITGTDIIDESPATVVVTAGGPASVETAVEPNPVAAGEPVVATCTALTAGGEEIATEMILVVDPSDDVDVNGLTATFTVAGEYDVACQVVGGVVDESPVEVTVTPGPLAAVTAQLADEEIAAGGETTVTCVAADEFGNAITGLSFDATADEYVTVDGMVVSATLVGLYDVNCALNGDDDSGVSYEAAELSVVAGPAAELVLAPVPDKTTYKVGNQVTIETTVTDAYGNVVPEAAVTEVTPSPEELVTRLEGDVFRFLAEGVVAFSAELVDDSSISDVLELTCDGTGPAVVIDYPLRGATIEGAPVVTVTGQVIDEVTGVQSFTINEEEVTIAEDGSFAHPIDAIHGMNIIATTATDGANQTENSWRSFYYSDAWYPVDVAAPLDGLVQDGVLAFIDQQTLETTDPEWPEDAVDLAGLMTTLLAEFDLMSVIENPVTVQEVTWCNYAVNIDELRFGTPVLHITSFGGDGSPGGIRIEAVLPDIHGHADLPAPEFACPDLSGSVSADRIELTATLILAVNNGVVTSSLTVDNVDVVEPDVDVDGVAGFLFNWIINFFENDLADMLTDEFESIVADEVQPLLDQLANYMSINEQVEIPPLVGEGLPTVLTVQTAPSYIEFDAEGGEIGLHTSVLAERIVDRDPLGSIGRGSCTGGVVGAYMLDREQGVELAAADDLLNQALFSVWYGGALEIALTAEEMAEMGADLSQFGITDMAVAVHLLAQPMLEGCANDGKLVLQVGDALLDASFGFMGQPVDLSMYLQVAIDADLVLVDGDAGPEIGIQLGEIQTLEAEVVDINEEQAGREETFANLVRTAVPPLLDDFADEPITFAIPSFDISGVMEGLPEGMWLTVKPQLLGRDLGYTEVGAYLAEGTPEETTPEPEPAE